MIKIEKLSVEDIHHKKLLKNVELSLQRGEILGLTGPSGAGKTTLIKSIMGLLDYNCKITSGSIYLDDENLNVMSSTKRHNLCGTTIGFIPQNPMIAFDKRMKIGKQIIETFCFDLKIKEEKAEYLAKDVLSKVNFPDVDRVLNSYSSQLSGGMLQRVAFAILLGLNPKYILADEPTSALDEKNRDILLELLQKYKGKVGTLFLSHDVCALKNICDRIIILKDGEIIEHKKTKEIFLHPESEWTKEFIKASNKQNGGEGKWMWKTL